MRLPGARLACGTGPPHGKRAVRVLNKRDTFPPERGRGKSIPRLTGTPFPARNARFFRGDHRGTPPGAGTGPAAGTIGLRARDAGKPGISLPVTGVLPGTAGPGAVPEPAGRVPAQDRYLTPVFPPQTSRAPPGRSRGARRAGFPRYLIQVTGAGEGRPAVIYHGAAPGEGYAEAPGADPRLRRRGAGTALQEHAMPRCRPAGCYQMRSRSPASASGNHALELSAGYVPHPSRENDSCYFIIRLQGNLQGKRSTPGIL